MMIRRWGCNVGVVMKWLPFAFSLFMLLVNLSSPHVYGVEENDEKGFFVVTGHLYDKEEETGIKQDFLKKAVPFINRVCPDFLILTGDIVFGGKNGKHRFPIETIRQRYNFFFQNVINRIETRVYCVAGNHDTGWIPHPPSVEIFEKELNPLNFSFEHKGSLFILLSLYQPFPHLELGSYFFPLKRVWGKYDTSVSCAFLKNLSNTFQSKYDHIFIFVHISPISDFPIGYYWNQFLIPLLSDLKQDIHIFSTDQITREPLIHNVNRVVRYNNIRFYCFARFPRGSYLVHFDNYKVKVDFLQGSNLIPIPIQEIDFKPTTRLSMLRCYFYARFISYPKRIIIWYSFKYFGKAPKAVLRDYYHKLLQKVRQFFG